jgi:dTDP-4-amino-4,6-dideoxygalactose transaminase
VAEPILVTRPYLPPLSELLPKLEHIWETRCLSNCGPCHEELEARLRVFLGAPNLSLVVNGMSALEAAIHVALGEEREPGGEIVTTPYSFAATAHAVKRSGMVPVFADVRPSDLNVDPERVEAAITPRTRAIVAVHCYGNPCDVEALEAIARRHRLKLIYDAAHAFGVTLRGRSLLAFGDFATLSFHATKCFNTFEGGAVVCRAPEDRRRIERYRNFGIEDELSIPDVGTNAKMNELNAAVGLVQLDHFQEVRALRAEVDRHYREAFAEIEGIEPLASVPDAAPSHAYFPVLVGDDFPLTRDELVERLGADGVHARRYFHPLLSNLAPYRTLDSAAPENLLLANRAAERVICLPIYPDLSEADQQRVLDPIRAACALGGVRGAA